MINQILETQHATTYYAMCISQNYISDKNFIVESEIVKTIIAHIDSELLTDEAKSDYEKLARAIESDKASKTDSASSTELDKLIVKYHDKSKLNSWEDLIKLFTLVAIASDICSQYNANPSIVERSVKACTDNTITNWIVVHGGWNAYYKQYTDAKNEIDKKEKKPESSGISTKYKLFGLGAVTTVITSIVVYFTSFHKKK